MNRHPPTEGFFLKKDLCDGRAGLKAIQLKAQYEQATTEEAQVAVVEQMKVLAAAEGGSNNVQLYASQLYMQHGMTKDALKCVHLGSTMEHVSMSLQIYLKLDRIDLAQDQLSSLRQTDEDAVLTSLGSIHISLATGRSTAADALHVCNALSEQYGPSPLLLNLMACAHMTLAAYDEAEQRLLECKREFPGAPNPDTLINLIVCSQYLGKDSTPLLGELKEGFPAHPFVAAWSRVEGAFERESIKYKTKA